MSTGGNFLFNTYCTGVAIKTQPRCLPASAVCYHPTRHMPDTAPPQNRKFRSDVISDVTDVTLTSSGLGIVTLPLIADSGWLKLKFRLIFKIMPLYQIQMAVDL